MNVMENMPDTFGVETPLFLSEIHTLQAIGRTKENNIWTIGLLGVTPSAASQTVTRLKKERICKENAGIRNEKEVSLVLTPAGKIAYDNHEKDPRTDVERIFDRLGTLTGDERVFLAGSSLRSKRLCDERIAELSDLSDGGKRSA